MLFLAVAFSMISNIVSDQRIKKNKNGLKMTDTKLKPDNRMKIK
jgi:hypothetical protein